LSRWQLRLSRPGNRGRIGRRLMFPPGPTRSRLAARERSQCRDGDQLASSVWSHGCGTRPNQADLPMNAQISSVRNC
jgi:hypothetical protein